MVSVKKSPASKSTEKPSTKERAKETVAELPTKKTASRTVRFSLWFVLAVGFVLLSALISGVVYVVMITELEEEELFSGCNVVALDLRGYLTTYIPPSDGEEVYDATSSESLVDLIDLAREDSRVKAVLLSVDSSGGDPVAGEEVALALRRLSKPSLAVIRGLGASAAYWAATGADQIYASRLSEVGGLGITASYLDESDKNKQEGYIYTELSSAKYKDLLDPARPLSEEDRELILADLAKMHEIFVSDVAINRGLEVGQVRDLANGLTYLGADALAHGLIDEIGGLDTAERELELRIGAPVSYCWY